VCGSDRQWQNVILRLPHCEKIFHKRNITFATVKGLNCILLIGVLEHISSFVQEDLQQPQRYCFFTDWIILVVCI